MVRIIILVVIGLLSFLIVFIPGYILIVPKTSDMTLMEEPSAMGDMEPAEEEMLFDSDELIEEPPPPPEEE